MAAIRMRSGWVLKRLALKAGVNVGRGTDDTLFAKVTGVVTFKDRGQHGRFVSVVAQETASN